MTDYKQIIVMRTDLNMRKGKMVAQGAHASLAVTLANLDDYRVKEWLEGSFTKICVRAESEQQLVDLFWAAKDAHLLVHEIVDSGKTEFNGEPTLTCIAIGPDQADELAPVTGGLKLL